MASRMFPNIPSTYGTYRDHPWEVNPKVIGSH